jgi:hypothetical protein
MVGFKDDRDPLFTTAQIGRSVICSPDTVVRWIQRGVLLSDGSREFLVAFSTPKGWRIRQSALNTFLTRVTADRALKPDPAPTTSAQAYRLARMKAGLEAQGFSTAK